MTRSILDIAAVSAPVLPPVQTPQLGPMMLVLLSIVCTVSLTLFHPQSRHWVLEMYLRIPWAEPCCPA